MLENYTSKRGIDVVTSAFCLTKPALLLLAPLVLHELANNQYISPI